jgi:hypothetical protein
MYNLNQDIQKMHILPPHCPLYPKEYTQFFNDDTKLKSMSPYKLINAKHPKDGKIYQKLEYNNFYTDWKQDSLKWYKPLENEYISVEETKHNYEPNIFNNIKTNNNFAIPLVTNGTNQLNIIFNNKCTGSTFNYKRYASSSINNKEWFNNPLYSKDISQETQKLKNVFMNDINQNGMDLYSSVFEDMYILGYDPGETSQNNLQDKVYSNLHSNSINNIRKS